MGVVLWGVGSRRMDSLRRAVRGARPSPCADVGLGERWIARMDSGGRGIKPRRARVCMSISSTWWEGSTKVLAPRCRCCPLVQQQRTRLRSPSVSVHLHPPAHSTPPSPSLYFQSTTPPLRRHARASASKGSPSPPKSRLVPPRPLPPLGACRNLLLLRLLPSPSSLRCSRAVDPPRLPPPPSRSTTRSRRLSSGRASPRRPRALVKVRVLQRPPCPRACRCSPRRAAAAWTRRAGQPPPLVNLTRRPSPPPSLPPLGPAPTAHSVGPPTAGLPPPPPPPLPPRSAWTRPSPFPSLVDPP